MGLALTQGAGLTRQRKEVGDTGVAAVPSGETLLQIPWAFSLAPCLFLSPSREATWTWIYGSF